jgi:CheY-like chemotaxis protein
MTRLLVVDDDVTIRSVMAELLESKGYVVDTAGDGVHALQRVRERCPRRSCST